MSFSQPKQNKRNPAKLFIEYKGGDGVFQYWDADADKLDSKGNVVKDKKGIPLKGMNIIIPTEEMKFIVLDKNLMSITGYSKAHDCGIYSNEVRSVEDILVVKLFDQAKSLIAKGNYASVKSAAKALGGKYTRCVYILFKDQLCHLKLSTTAFSAWAEDIESLGEVRLTQYWVTVKELEQKKIEIGKNKKNEIEFFKPRFETRIKIGEKSASKAREMDKDLQEYLEDYLAKGKPNDHTEDSQEQLPIGDVDTTQWKKFQIPKTVIQLGTMTFQKLVDLKDKLESEGEVENPLYQNVCRGISEYQKAMKTWKETKTKQGTKLGSLTYDELVELKSIIARKNPFHELSHFVEVGIMELSEKQSTAVDDDEDDIPF